MGSLEQFAGCDDEVESAQTPIHNAAKIPVCKHGRYQLRECPYRSNDKITIIYTQINVLYRGIHNV